MFIFSDDKNDNMSLLSDLYGAECSRIDSLCVRRQERRQLHDNSNIMTRSMSKAKQANVPAIYPLKGEHKKPEHMKPDEVKGKTGDEKDHHEQFEPIEMPVIEEFSQIPKVNEPTSLQGEANSYQTPVIDKQVRRPNPLLKSSSYPQVIIKQLPKCEGILKPQPIEIELTGRLPSYEVGKSIEMYPFTMDIPSIEELKEKKRKYFHKIPEETVFRKLYQNRWNWTSS